MAAARRPGLYAGLGVEDSVDGRFDMVVLHVFLVLDRLKGMAGPFRQALVDEFFRDMDRSLREMGVGDLSVAKKVRKMAEAFYGRVAAYDRALAGPEGELAAAIARNVFAADSAAADSASARRLAAYVLDQRAHLAAQPAAAIIAGNADFREPAP